MVTMLLINTKARFSNQWVTEILSHLKMTAILIVGKSDLSNGVTYCIDENGIKIAETLKWDNAPLGSRFDECDAYRY